MCVCVCVRAKKSLEVFQLKAGDQYLNGGLGGFSEQGPPTSGGYFSLALSFSFTLSPSLEEAESHIKPSRVRVPPDTRVIQA